MRKFQRTLAALAIGALSTNEAIAQDVIHPDTVYLSAIPTEIGLPRSVVALKLAGLGRSASASVASRAFPELRLELEVPADSFVTYATPFNGPNTIGEADAVTDGALRINASSPIMVYEYVEGEDISFVPSRYLAGFEHMVLAYPLPGYAEDWSKPPKAITYSFCICALQDSTEVEIWPSVGTVTGKPANTAILKELDDGQCYIVRSDTLIPYADLTGTRIRSNRPTHLYVSNGGQAVPYDSAAHVYRGRHTHTREYIPPISRWGTAVIAGSLFPGDSTDVTKVVASEDNTQLYLDGEPAGPMLSSGQYHELWIREDMPQMLTSNKPFMAAIFSRGELHYADPEDTSRAGTMSLLPRLDDLTNDYTVFLGGERWVYQNFHAVKCYADMESIHSLKVDGKLVDTNLFTEVGSWNGRRFGVATIILPAGLHRITSDAESRYGFALIAFGRSSAGLSIGYAYTLSKMYIPLHERPTGSVPAENSESTRPSLVVGGRSVLSFEIARSGHGTLRVYSVDGRSLDTKEAGWLAAGSQELEVDLPVSPGVYLIELEVGPSRYRQKILKQ